MSTEVLAALIATLSGLAGYIFREYKNQVEPFFEVLKIGGEYTRNYDHVSVEKDTIEKLKNTFYLSSLDEDTTFGEVDTVWQEADEFVKGYPDVRKAVDKVLLSKSDYDFLDSLAALFRWRYFAKWMIPLLFQDKIPFSDLPEGLEQKINVIDDDGNEGSVWLTFPQRNIRFGESLKAPIMRAKCDPFLYGVKCLHRPFIDKVLSIFLDLTEKEYSIANQVHYPLSELRKKHSRWGIYTFIANLNNYPIIIETTAKILIRDVRDKKIAEFSEDCDLALISQDENGRPFMQRLADMPIVLQAASSLQLGFLTKNTQGDMKFGGEIRSVFVRGQATCQIEITLRKVGLLKKQKYRSQKFPFSQM